MDHIRRAQAVIDALADADYIPDHLATNPDRFEVMLTVAAEAILRSDREVERDEPR